MTDTPRTIAALQALFADNNTGDISAQDLRDFLVTVVNFLDPVAMAPLTDTDVALTINMPTGSQAEGTNAFVINPDPDVDNGGSPFVEMGNFDVNISGPADNDPAFQLFESDGNGTVSFSPGQGVSSTPSESNALALTAQWASGTTPHVVFGNLLSLLGKSSGAILADVRVNSEGFMILAKHAAPDDAMLQSGDLAFWFDQTNGAAKLMLKGKSANGTVVTGNVALS